MRTDVIARQTAARPYRSPDYTLTPTRRSCYRRSGSLSFATIKMLLRCRLCRILEVGEISVNTPLGHGFGAKRELRSLDACIGLQYHHRRSLFRSEGSRGPEDVGGVARSPDDFG
jgi:hypothetical protein